jgi:transposase
VAAEEELLQKDAQHIQEELDKAADAGRTLSGTEQLLRRLHETLDDDLSWETKRRIVEALVDGADIEMLQQGEQRVPRITIRYRFDEPQPSVSRRAQARHRTDARAVRCLGIERELQWSTEDDSPRARALALVKQKLLERPDLQLDELRQAVRDTMGMRVSRASMCRMRHEAAVPLTKRRPSDDPSSLAGRTRCAVRDVLERYPTATLRELTQLVRDEHGITIGTSNMARIRQQLRMVEKFFPEDTRCCERGGWLPTSYLLHF